MLNKGFRSESFCSCSAQSVVGNMSIHIMGPARPGTNRSQKYHRKTEINHNMHCKLVDKQGKLRCLCVAFTAMSLNPILWDDPQQQLNMFFKHMM